MSREFFTLPSTDVTHVGYRMVAYSITPISFLVAITDDYVDLERRYFELELRLNNTSTGLQVQYMNWKKESQKIC